MGEERCLGFDVEETKLAGCAEVHSLNKIKEAEKEWERDGSIWSCDTDENQLGYTQESGGDDVDGSNRKIHVDELQVLTEAVEDASCVGD